MNCLICILLICLDVLTFNYPVASVNDLCADVNRLIPVACIMLQGKHIASEWINCHHHNACCLLLSRNTGVVWDMRCVRLQEMTGKEVEYVFLSRDTTEADLKQRREISSGTAIHLDQVGKAKSH